MKNFDCDFILIPGFLSSGSLLFKNPQIELREWAGNGMLV